MARLRFRLRLRLRLRLGVRLRLRVRVRVRRRLAVEVYGEVGRVEVRDLRGGVGHQVGQALGQRVRRARGEHAHELLEGEEGRAQLEGGRGRGVHGVGDVRGEGRVVVRVEPCP